MKSRIFSSNSINLGYQESFCHQKNFTHYKNFPDAVVDQYTRKRFERVVSDLPTSNHHPRFLIPTERQIELRVEQFPQLIPRTRNGRQGAMQFSMRPCFSQDAQRPN